MDWIEVTVITTNAGIEPVTGRIYQLGINGVSIEDEQEFCDFLEENKSQWDYVDDELMESMKKPTEIKLYLTDNADGYEMLSLVKSSMRELCEYDENGEFGSLEVRLNNISEEDWANNWKQYFHPLKIGDKILVCPEWESCENPDGRTVFRINPGMSFGTGSHHTTRLCLEEIEARVKEGDTVADIGSGSGILSIISLQLGAKSAVAVDIDPNSVNIAYENAERNNISKDRFTAIAGNILTDDELRNKISENKYKLVLANIVADVIIPLSPLAYELVDDDGIFITSGIIEDRQDEVKAALIESGFEVVKRAQSADWIVFVCKKKQ